MFKTLLPVRYFEAIEMKVRSNGHGAYEKERRAKCMVVAACINARGEKQTDDNTISYKN